MTLTRVYRFAASHRLHSQALSAEENRELYGKCNNPYGHGHDYVLHISVEGSISATTGRLINISALDRYVHENVIVLFDHRDMNLALDDFKEAVPTTENVTYAIERRLRASWEATFKDLRLCRIFIEETARNAFELRIA